MKNYSLLFIIITLLVLFSCNNENEIKEYQPEELTYTQGDTLTVTGMLVDSHCYALDKQNVGHDHQLPESGYREDCAEYCALQGYPVGVLKQDEQKEKQSEELWVIMTASQIFADYMTQTVRVQGTVRTDGLLDPLQVELKSGPDEWITIM